MSNPKNRHTRQSTIASKLATIASPTPARKLTPEEGEGGGISMSQLLVELSKQRVSLRVDISTLIQDSIGPLQTSVNAIQETVASFQSRLTATETRVGENFDKIFAAETTIKSSGSYWGPGESFTTS